MKPLAEEASNVREVRSSQVESTSATPVIPLPWFSSISNNDSLPVDNKSSEELERNWSFREEVVESPGRAQAPVMALSSWSSSIQISAPMPRLISETVP